MDQQAGAWRERLARSKQFPRRLWSRDVVRLPVLTVYYLAIIVALIILYGGTTYTPPPFIYQGF